MSKLKIEYISTESKVKTFGQLSYGDFFMSLGSDVLYQKIYLRDYNTFRIGACKHYNLEPDVKVIPVDVHITYQLCES